MSKVSIVGDVFKFLVKAVVTALILGVIIKTPVMAKAIWSYCTGVDKGYMWVVNMACAMVVALVTWAKLRRIRVPFRAIVSAFAFAVMLFFAEVFFWHATEIWQLISMDITVKEMSAAGFTLLAVTIAYIFHTVPQWRSDDEDTPAQNQ